MNMLNRKDHTMKAKDYKSITELLKQKYNKNFYDFEDFADVLLKIKKKARTNDNTRKN